MSLAAPPTPLPAATPPHRPGAPAALSEAIAALAERLDAALPQTQCTRCGYPDCRGYAEAMAAGAADINRCPPGGAEGIARLARLTGRTPSPLDPACGAEGPLKLALIDEAWCIGCTLCLKACPVDCIAGATKRMHTVIDEQCTGCELCVPACPVDCIAMVPVMTARTGWAAWSDERAAEARARYAAHRERVEREAREESERLEAATVAQQVDLPAPTRPTEPPSTEARRAVIEAALQRARARRENA